MKVFVAGASGVIGRPVVTALLRHGHRVTAMTRSEARAKTLRDAGAETVVCDVFDGEALHRVVEAAAPDVVVHELTALPWRIDPRKAARDLAPTNRIRTEGTDRLLEAAAAAGAVRFVAQSVAFAYAPSGTERLSEDAPLLPPGIPGAKETIAAIRHLEGRVAEVYGSRGLVLRYGFFYGPGTAYAADGSLHEDVRKRKFPVIGEGRGHFSFVHVEDAAQATALAVGSHVSGVVNVVEDQPAKLAEWLPLYAKQIGAKPPRRFPRWLVRLAAGPYALYLGDEMPGAANDRAATLLGWRPHHHWRDAPVLDAA